MGSSTYTSVATFEAECRTLIEAVGASSESRGPQQLTATTQPFDIEGDGKSLGHLLYDCYVATGEAEAVYGESELHRWGLVVDILYAVGPGNERRADVDAATNLAHRVQSAFVLSEGCPSWSTEGPPQRSWVRVRGRSSQFLRLRLRLAARVLWTAA